MRKRTAWSLCLLALAWAGALLCGCSGCQKPAPKAPRTLTTFSAGVTPGLFSHDVVLMNRNNRLLRSVDVTVTIYYEAKVETVTRHWAYWNHEQSQTINLPAHGTIQQVVVEGTAVAGAEREAVQLYGGWLFSYGQTK